MATPTSARRAFATLVRRLRATETQAAFAARLHVSRSVLANVETGHRPPTAPLVAALIAAFPNESDAIQQGFLALRTTPTPRAEISMLQARAHQLLAYGRHAEAILAVRNGLRTIIAPADRAALNKTLSHLHFSVGSDEAGLAALRTAVAAYSEAGLDAEAAQTLAHVAGQLFRRGRFEEACSLTSAGLQSFPEASELWRIRGTVAWYRHNYTAAYASLTTSLHFGSLRRVVLNARGQVLAEWGSLTTALNDLHEALSDNVPPEFDADGGVAEASLPHGKAYALSALAYCHWLLGQESLGLKEFEAAAAVTPDNAWLYYRWARCYDKSGNTPEATILFQRALSCRTPPLNPLKAEMAKEWLRENNAA